MAKKDNIVVGLDIGTTKICAVVGQVTDEGMIDIVGIGSARSTGMKRGVVVDIVKTVEGIRQAVEEAERMSGCEISSVYTGISGGHIRGFNSNGVVKVKDGEIDKADVARVIDSAKAVAIPMDREVIHILPQQYVIDDHDGVKEPLGMHGVRLEAKVHIVTAASASARNIIKCANEPGLGVSAVVLQQLASAEAVLTDEERDLGVCLVDIGGGTTDIAIFHGGAIVHTAVIPLGGESITHDIAFGIRTPHEDAERIKCTHGSALLEDVDPSDEIEVPSVGGKPSRPLKRNILCEIIEARVEEIFQLVREEIRNTPYEEFLPSGVVLTGGTARLAGIGEVAEDVLGLPIRMGTPQGVAGLADVVKSPQYATGVGLVLHGAKAALARPGKMGNDETIYRGMTRKMREWFGQIF